MIDELKKNVTVFSRSFVEGTYKITKNIYKNAAVTAVSSGTFSENGIAVGGSAIIRIFGSAMPCVNIGDKIVIGSFDGDNPPDNAYSAAQIADNRRGSLPHIRIIAER